MTIKDDELNALGYLTDRIKHESKQQIDKWGIQDRHIFEWAMWTTEEFGEFIQAINEYTYGRAENIDEIMKEGIQTVTLIIKILGGLLEQEGKDK